MSVVDGTFTQGLDQRAGVWFQTQGMNLTEVGAADGVYSSTVVVVYGPKLYTLKYLQETFGVSHTQIKFNPDPNSTVDIEIRLGGKRSLVWFEIKIPSLARDGIFLFEKGTYAQP